MTTTRRRRREEGGGRRQKGLTAGTKKREGGDKFKFKNYLKNDSVVHVVVVVVAGFVVVVVVGFGDSQPPNKNPLFFHPRISVTIQVYPNKTLPTLFRSQPPLLIVR